MAFPVRFRSSVVAGGCVPVAVIVAFGGASPATWAVIPATAHMRVGVVMPSLSVAQYGERVVARGQVIGRGVGPLDRLLV